MQLQRSIAAFAALVIAGAATAAGEHGAHGRESKLGKPGKAVQASRTVEIDMLDNMRFKPESLQVKQGETIRFRVKNSGRLRHEMVIGTAEELREHYAMMMKMPGMEHAEDNMVGVDPSGTGELVWQFTRAGIVDFACLQPRHFDAGMKGQVRVAAPGRAPKGAAASDPGH